MQDPSTAEINADGMLSVVLHCGHSSHSHHEGVAVAMSDSSLDQSMVVSEDEISDSTSSSSDEEEIAGEPEVRSTCVIAILTGDIFSEK